MGTTVSAIKRDPLTSRAQTESDSKATFDAVKWLRYMADKERVLDPKFRPCPEKYDQAADEIERLRARDAKLHGMLEQMRTEATGRLLGYPHWLEEILYAE